MTTHKLILYSEKLAQYLERVKKGSDEREAMRQVIKKEKNERPEMVYLTFLCYACVQERTWLTLSYPPLKPSLSLSISSSQQQSLSFSHILLNQPMSQVFLSLKDFIMLNNILHKLTSIQFPLFSSTLSVPIFLLTI